MQFANHTMDFLRCTKMLRSVLQGNNGWLLIAWLPVRDYSIKTKYTVFENEIFFKVSKVKFLERKTVTGWKNLFRKWRVFNDHSLKVGIST